MFVDYGISSNSIDNNYLKNDYNLKTNDNLINIAVIVTYLLNLLLLLS